MFEPVNKPIKIVPAKSLDSLAKKLNEKLAEGYQPLNVFTFQTLAADRLTVETVFAAVVVSVEAIEDAPMEIEPEPTKPEPTPGNVRPPSSPIDF